jgi:wyosine [tRNA(Phe)-imidazoG37] synthetase (radical SAM superfamily)
MPEPIDPSSPFARHPRDWHGNDYVYPVISRRSRGLSIGINLNPDAACNFDCVYCQVDRTQPPRVREVVLPRLHAELHSMLALAAGGELFTEPEFKSVAPDHRKLSDIAFSGDGEPTACPVFAEAASIAAAMKRRFGLSTVKLVLITDACYLTRPEVEKGLEVLDASQGEIWAKLDAGTEAYFRRVNKPNVPLQHVLENITAAAKRRTLCIQSLFMQLGGAGPAPEELDAYVARLREIVQAGGRIRNVQVYTVARKPADPEVTALPAPALEAIAARVRQDCGLTADVYPGVA